MGKFFRRSYRRKSLLKKLSKPISVFLVFMFLLLIGCLVVYKFREEVIDFFIVAGKVALILVVAYLLYLVLFKRR